MSQSSKKFLNNNVPEGFTGSYQAWQDFLSVMHNSYKKGTERKPMEAKKFAIFMNNGDIITINAGSFTWADDGTLIFYDNSIDEDIVAVFKQNVLFGVSECCFELHEKQLMLPKYDDEDKSEMETVEC